MVDSARGLRLAVLIDAENIPARVADTLLASIDALGTTIVRRAYGDFTNPGLASWVEACARLCLQPQLQVARPAGKNAADIALVIEAMDLLYERAINAFAIATSDSDFTRLVQRLRQSGNDVFGFGEEKTPTSFRQACSRFTPFELLKAAPLPHHEPCVSARPPNPIAPAPQYATPVAPPVQRSAPAQTAAPDQATVRLIRDAIRQIPSSNGWVGGSPLGQQIRKLKPGFEPSHAGHATLRKLVEKSGAFETRMAAGILQIRPKSVN